MPVPILFIRERHTLSLSNTSPSAQKKQLAPKRRSSNLENGAMKAPLWRTEEIKPTALNSWEHHPPRRANTVRIKTNIRISDAQVQIQGKSAYCLPSSSLPQKTYRNFIYSGNQWRATGGQLAHGGAHLQALVHVCPRPDSRLAHVPPKIGCPIKMCTHTLSKYKVSVY